MSVRPRLRWRGRAHLAGFALPHKVRLAPAPGDVRGVLCGLGADWGRRQTYEAADVDPVGVRLAAGRALHLEGEEVGVVFRVEGAEVGHAAWDLDEWGFSGMEDSLVLTRLSRRLM